MESPKPESSSICHVVAVPYPGRGHINPMMNLCKLLCSRSPHILITFVVTEEWFGFIGSDNKPANVRFGTIPNVIPSELVRAKDFPAFIVAVLTKMEAPFEELLDRLEPPVTLIIADTYMAWTVEVGKRRNIPVASLWTMSASVLSVFHHFKLLVENQHFPADLSEAAITKFQNSNFRPVPQPPDFHPEVTVSPHDGLHFWQFMIAGSIAGCVEHMSMFPVDTVKTHMQALGSCPIKSVGVRHALRSILKSEGPAGFYRGIGAMGLGAGPAHAVYFYVYEVCKKYFCGGNPNNSAAHAVSGVFATVASDAVFTPMDMVKQRLQLGNSAAYRGVLDCVKKVLKEEGFGAFYASYRTTVLMNAPFTAVHFATYEAAKRGLIEISPESASDERVVVHATAGALAGASAALVTTPLDVVKTQLQCQGVCGCDRFKSSSIKDVVKTIVQKDGYKGLMRGWIPRMLFHAPAAAICWSTYEAGKTFFQELNASAETGSVI